MDGKQLIDKVKQYPLAVGGVALCIILGGYIFLTSGRLEALEAAYAEADLEERTMQQNDMNAVGLAADVELAKELVKEIDSRLMVLEAKAEHYQYFLMLAETSGVIIGDPRFLNFIDPSDRRARSTIKEFAQIDYSLSVRGDFNKVMNFLYALRTGRFFAKVVNLRLATTPAELEAGGCTAEVMVRILAVKPEPEKPTREGR